MKSTIAIQIVNYKTKEFLSPLLNSIFKDISKSNVDVEVNILDNASGDDLQSIADTWNKYNVHTYSSKKNNGFGAGHNTLAHKTTKEYLLILNPDLILIEDNTIKRLLDTLISTRATVVGPKLLTPKSRKNKSLVNLPREYLHKQIWDHSEPYASLGIFKKHDQPYKVSWVSGAVFLIKRSDFIKIQGFDEKFFLYCEELDLCRRLRKKDKLIIYNPDINVLHYGSAVAGHTSRHFLKSVMYYEYKRLKEGLGL